MSAKATIAAFALIVGPLSAYLVFRMFRAWGRGDRLIAIAYALAVPVGLVALSALAVWLKSYAGLAA